MQKMFQGFLMPNKVISEGKYDVFHKEKLYQSCISYCRRIGTKSYSSASLGSGNLLKAPTYYKYDF